MRSLHIIGSRQFGGAENFYARLIAALNEQPGHRALAVNRPSSAVRQALGGEEGQLHVPMRNGWDLPSVFGIRRLVKETGAEIVQSYMGRATRLTRVPRGWPAVHVARLGGFYKIDGYYRHADAWVGNTRELCDFLIREGLPAARVYHIGNFVESPPPTGDEELRQLRRSLDIPAEAVVLFSLGRFIAKKGFDDLLEAFARLPQEIHGRPLCLVVAGDGPLRDILHSRARDLDLEGRLRWAGWQNSPGPFFDMADIFICPSREETLGNVILEAWAHRLPVVSTRCSGPLELITEGENGLLCPCKDSRALADRLLELLTAGPAGWKKLAENGAGILASGHSKAAVVRQYLTMYDELLQNHR